MKENTISQIIKDKTDTYRIFPKPHKFKFRATLLVGEALALSRILNTLDQVFI